MTILSIFLINQIRTGGDRDYIELLELLAERGNKVFVILNTYLDYQPKKIIPIYLTIKYIKHKLPPASFLFKHAIKKYLSKITINFNKKLPDFIHIHGDIYLKSALFLKRQLNISLFYASRLNDISKIITLRKYKALSKIEYFLSFLFELINRYREKQIASHSNLICFLNPFDRDIFLSRTKRKKNNAIVIPNYIGLPRFTEGAREKNISTHVSRIVYVGSLSSNKGIQYLLRAADILKCNGYSLHYYLLGRIEDEYNTLLLIEKLGLKNIVSIEGFESPFKYFINCDLFVYPTLYDDWGNVITEALHCGCPVIASNSTGPAYILKHKDLLFDIGNPNEIAKKIMLCINDNEYYKKIRHLCSERTKFLRFDWAEQFETAMKNYLSKKEAHDFTLY